MNWTRYLVYLLLAGAMILPMVIPIGLPFGDDIPEINAEKSIVKKPHGMKSSSGKMPPPGMKSPHSKIPPAEEMEHPHKSPHAMAVQVFRPASANMSQHPVERLYRAIDCLPAEAIVLLGVDFGFANKAEMLPLLTRVVEHIFQGDRRLIVISLSEEGPLFSKEPLTELAEKHDAAYGSRWVLLGTIPGEEAALLRFGNDMRSVFTVDMGGVHLDELSMMDDVNSASKLSLAVDLADNEGTPISYVKMLGYTGLPIGAATTCNVAPNLMPYMQSGQILGLAAGLPGAAHYKYLSGKGSELRPDLDALSLGGILLLVLILVGNFLSPRRG